MKKFAKITAVVLVAVMALAMLTACGYPSDPQKAKEKLEKQGYKATVVESPVAVAGLKAYVTGIKEEDGKVTTIQVAYYEDADSAKTAYEKAKDSLEKSKESNEKMGIKGSVSRSGKQVIAKTVADTNKK